MSKSDNWATSKVEMLKVSELTPYERNAKVHPPEQIAMIANSIREWGWTQPILVDEKNVVLAGHGRLYAAQQMRISEVPCARAVNWSEDQKRAYVIADNKLSEQGEWDVGMLLAEVRSLSDADFDLDLMGIDIDLSAVDFSPNLNPVSGGGQVDERDMEKAAEKLDQQFTPSVQLTEAVCPACGHEFMTSGS